MPIEVLGFLLLKIERGNACGRKGSIRDLQPGRQLYSQGTDGVHRERDKLRHAGGAPRHSPDQQDTVLPGKAEGKKYFREKVWTDCGRTERAVENDVVMVKVDI